MQVAWASGNTTEDSGLSGSASAFLGATFTGMSTATATLSGPVDTFDNWVSRASALSGLDLAFQVWGKNGTFSLTTELEEGASVNFGGHGVSICFNGDTPCEDDRANYFSASDNARPTYTGTLIGGEVYILQLTCHADAKFTQLTVPDSGSKTITVDASATLSVSH